MDEEQKYLEEKHNKGLILNDEHHDWGGCPSTYEEETDKQFYNSFILKRTEVNHKG